VEIIANLRAIVAQGYLLHGSRFDVEVLEPRQGRCQVKREGCQQGVYATRNVGVALLAAMLHPKAESIQRLTEWSAHSDHIVASGKNVELGLGYVYVCPIDTFKVVHMDNGEETNEFVSAVPVKPLDKVRVTPDLLAQLDVSLNLT